MVTAQARTSLYYQVVEVTVELLGPAAKRFIDRQIKTHINKRPEDLTAKDLEKLIDWIKLAVSLLTEDRKLVEEFADNLTKLTNNRSKK